MHSLYASQVVIVHKKSGEIHLCIDYSSLNAITVHDSFPLPRIEEALQAIKVAVWFTSFDLAQGYLQFAMDEADIHKTAFWAGSSGLYKFTHMPFSLSNAGASFCRLMKICSGDQQYIMLLFYLDDICVSSSMVDEMLDCIGLVLNHLKEFNLKINPKKTYFFQSNVVFLGHVLSRTGISPNPEKVSKVKNWPVPKSAKVVHSFLGLASYYRFIPQFTKWASPLHELIRPATTKKKCAGKKIPPLLQNLPSFQCSPECQESFEKLKETLITTRVLSYPDYSKLFILEMDASLKGLGAVLSQEDSDSNVCDVSFMSHTLKPYEKSMKNYSSAKLKLLTLKWSVCEKFKDYLIGSKFTILTDNNPLTYVHTSRLGASQICWLSDLALFDFDIKNRAGKCNQAVDTLSRQPVNVNSSSESSDEDEEWETISYEMVCQVLNHHLSSTKLPYNIKLEVQTNITDVEMANNSIDYAKPNIIATQFNEIKLFDSISPGQMAENQKRDTQLSLVYEYVAHGHKPRLTEIHHIRSKPIWHLLLQFDHLSLVQGVLHHPSFNNNDEIQQLVLPISHA